MSQYGVTIYLAHMADGVHLSSSEILITFLLLFCFAFVYNLPSSPPFCSPFVFPLCLFTRTQIHQWRYCCSCAQNVRDTDDPLFLGEQQQGSELSSSEGLLEPFEKVILGALVDDLRLATSTSSGPGVAP